MKLAGKKSVFPHFLIVHHSSMLQANDHIVSDDFSIFYEVEKDFTWQFQLNYEASVLIFFFFNFYDISHRERVSESEHQKETYERHSKCEK